MNKRTRHESLPGPLAHMTVSSITTRSVGDLPYCFLHFSIGVPFTVICCKREGPLTPEKWKGIQLVNLRVFINIGNSEKQVFYPLLQHPIR